MVWYHTHHLQLTNGKQQTDFVRVHVQYLYVRITLQATAIIRKQQSNRCFRYLGSMEDKTKQQTAATTTSPEEPARIPLTTDSVRGADSGHVADKKKKKKSKQLRDAGPVTKKRSSQKPSRQGDEIRPSPKDSGSMEDERFGPSSDEKILHKTSTSKKKTSKGSRSTPEPGSILMQARDKVKEGSKNLPKQSGKRC